MLAVNDGAAEYPDRGALMGEVCALLKAARTPASKEWECYGLDRSG
jgi:hypothetical protein